MGNKPASATDWSARNALALIFFLRRQLDEAIANFQERLTPDLKVQIIREGLEHDDENPDTERVPERIADICLLLQEIATEAACELLLDLLNSDDAKTRASASEALRHVVCAKNPGVAMHTLNLAIDNPLTPDQTLIELPTILAGCSHPDRVKVCGALLQHRSADVVAHAIEGLVAIGNPEIMIDLRALSSDDRPITGDPEGGPGVLGGPAPRVRTVGELAKDAIRSLDLLNRRLSIVE